MSFSYSSASRVRTPTTTLTPLTAVGALAATVAGTVRRTTAPGHLAGTQEGTGCMPGSGLAVAAAD